MANLGSLYAKVASGGTLNLADIINNNGNKSLERIIVECSPAGGGGGISIQMPEVSALGAATNFNVLVIDKTGNAAAENITISRAGATDKINGANTTVINTANGAVLLNIGAVASGASSYMAVNTSSISTGAATQAHQDGVTAAGNVFQLANFPVRSDRHLIGSRLGAVIREGAGKDFTIDYASGLITMLIGAPGDEVNFFYSY